MACWCRQYQRLPTDSFTFPPVRAMCGPHCQRWYTHDDVFVHREKAHPQGFRQAALDPRGAVPAGHPGRLVPQFPPGRPRSGQAPRAGPACSAEVGFPDQQLQRQRRAGVRRLQAGRAGVRRARVPQPRPVLRRPAAGDRAPGDLRPRVVDQGDQVRQGTGGLPRRDPADDRARHLHRERYRARHRLAAAPQPGRVLRPRPRQDPQLGQAAVQRPHHFPTAAPGWTSSSTRTRCTHASTVAASCR